MNKQDAENIIGHVVTVTKPRWSTWLKRLSYKDWDIIFLQAAYEQGGFSSYQFYKVLEERGIASIEDLGSILEGYSGARKYVREEHGSIESHFYTEMRDGRYGKKGQLFYESVRTFLGEKRGKPGRMFWKLLWQMLHCCKHLKNKYGGSFKYYLKTKYCEFAGKPDISDDEFCEIVPEAWGRFVSSTKPWNELYGIGENVFDYLVRNIIEFRFNRDAFKLDAANVYFFSVTGINKLFQVGDRDGVMTFLKSLNLNVNYSLGEINTGIYTYCSETEKDHFGFCRDRNKCSDCTVAHLCEKNI